VPKVGMQPIRRAQILDAAFDSIAERSLEGTRMRNIAEAAGVSQPSLHYYFNTKDKLIVALLDRLLAEFRAEREEQLAAAEGPLARLRVMLAHQKQFIMENSDTFEVYYDFWVQATKRPSVGDKVRQMNSGWRAVIREVLEEGVKTAVFRADRVKMAPAILVSILQGAALQYILDPEDFDLDLYFEQAEQYLVHFLGTGKSD